MHAGSWRTEEPSHHSLAARWFATARELTRGDLRAPRRVKVRCVDPGAAALGCGRGRFGVASPEGCGSGLAVGHHVRHPPSRCGYCTCSSALVPPPPNNVRSFPRSRQGMHCHCNACEFNSKKAPPSHLRQIPPCLFVEAWKKQLFRRMLFPHFVQRDLPLFLPLIDRVLSMLKSYLTGPPGNRWILPAPISGRRDGGTRRTVNHVCTGTH